MTRLRTLALAVVLCLIPFGLQANDEIRGNMTAITIPFAAHTTDQTGSEFLLRGNGILLHVAVTTGSLTPSVTLNLRCKTGATPFVVFAAATPITSISSASYFYLIGPGAVAGSLWDEVDDNILFGKCEIFMDHADTDSLSYSVTRHGVNF